jgi:hypothetical protein
MENNGTSMCLVYIAFGYLLETFLLLVPILLIFDDFLLRDFASGDMKRKADLSVVCFSVVVVGGLDTIVLLLLLCGNTMMAHQHLIVSPLFFSFV